MALLQGKRNSDKEIDRLNGHWLDNSLHQRVAHAEGSRCEFIRHTRIDIGVVQARVNRRRGLLHRRHGIQLERRHISFT